jgi:hypothetical protein
MKKHHFFATALIAILLVFTQCKKTNQLEIPQDNQDQQKLNTLRKETLTLLLQTAKSNEVKKLVLNECLKQSHGDYYVKITDLSSKLRNIPGNETAADKLASLAQKTKIESGGRDAILFYPRAETIENYRKQRTRARAYEEQLYDPIGVYQEVFNPDYSSPGYIVNNGYDLVFYQNVSEDYAWENDVWVIGEEENVSDENLVAALEDISVARVQGQPEYGGIIQCTDLNAIEHWTSGKLEFKILVLNASGAKISQRGMGKSKRMYFRDQKWKDFGHFIGNWNTNTFGNWMYENWWEEDGGQSNSVTITMPPPAGQPGPTVSITVPSKNKDDDLGLATIQFSDPITQVYNLTNANIKRRN